MHFQTITALTVTLRQKPKLSDNLLSVIQSSNVTFERRINRSVHGNRSVRTLLFMFT